MDDFNDVLVPAAVAAGMVVASKKQLFQRLGDLAHTAYGLDASLVVERLTERERLGSTGFGGGIAIPHAKLNGLQGVCGAVMLLNAPIAFDAVDEAPVDVIFMLLSPADSGAEHLKTLARVSRFLRNEHHVARVRGVGSGAALYALLAGGEARDAA
jgi:nitrogen PTS system EIIA component